MITVTDLHKHHGELQVIKGISLHVTKGEVDAIIGPSGGGKSTFLRCLNGLETFQQGRVEIGAHVLTPATHPNRDAATLQAVRKSVGFVFQQFNLFPHLTVLGNLIEAPVQVLDEDRESAVARARLLLDRVQLAAKADVKPSSLSGGQQQRVAIARTLMMRPEAVLFDEPTSALDPVMAQEVLAVMGDLAHDGQTMLVVTHSMAFARNVATRVHVFAGGLDVESGPPAQIFDAPAHETTREFLRHTRA
ncbi:MAG: amino acid ABC transporter ATP-binding protein [Deltaproteobacteria bacterium]|nr:amino acid ABC transporter ATP-binding protein [Deltaproteobacteria bacterium]